MIDFRFEWQDVCNDTGTLELAQQILGDVVSITLKNVDDYIVHHLTPTQARALAGALLAAAQHIDPLPSTNPNPALTPDRLT